jgi:hypothetical protein
LYGVEAKVIDLERRLIKPSSADYVRREVIVAEAISGDPFNLEGQTVFKSMIQILVLQYLMLKYSQEGIELIINLDYLLDITIEI